MRLGFTQSREDRKTWVSSYVGHRGGAEAVVAKLMASRNKASLDEGAMLRKLVNQFFNKQRLDIEFVVTTIHDINL